MSNIYEAILSPSPPPPPPKKKVISMIGSASKFASYTMQDTCSNILNKKLE